MYTDPETKFSVQAPRLLPHDLVTRLKDHVFISEYDFVIYDTKLKPKERKQLESKGFNVVEEAKDIEDFGYCRTCGGMDENLGDEFYTKINTIPGSEIITPALPGTGYPKSSISASRSRQS